MPWPGRVAGCWTDRPPIRATVIEAGKQIGLEYREDVNDLPPGHQDCIGWCQQTRGGRRRARLGAPICTRH
jgi:hypothetical protein